MSTARTPAHPTPNSPRLAVLLVDDEPLIRWSLRQTLLNRGHEVVTAASAAEAVGALSNGGRFDVVVLEYRLPDRHDLTLVDEIRRASPGSAVFMMTAFGDEGMRRGARDRGVRAVVDKPFQVKTFVAMIEQAVA